MAFDPDGNVTVEVAWNSNSWATSPSYSNVTADTQAVTVRRGRTGLFGGPVQPGTATVVLESTDGSYNPRTVSQVPDRPIRIKVNGTAVFQGWVHDIVPEMTSVVQRVTLFASDSLRLLAETSHSDLDLDAALSGDRIQALLDDVSWSATYTGTIQSGQVLLPKVEGYTGRTLDHAAAAAYTEGGQLYSDTTGKVQYRQRHAHITETEQSTSQVTFGETGTSGTYVPIWSDGRSVSIVETLGGWRRVHRVVATAYTGTVYQSSGRKNRPHIVYKRVVPGYVEDDGSAATIFKRTRDLGQLACYYDTDGEYAVKMYRNANNTNQVYPSQFTVRVDPGNAQALTEVAAGDIDLFTRCTVKYTPPGAGSQQTANCVIEGLTWTMTLTSIDVRVDLSNWSGLYADTNWAKFGTALTASSIMGY